MDEILMSTMCLFLLMTLAISRSIRQEIFGPPRVTLNCSADYVALSKIVEVSWKPTLVNNETFSEAIDDRIQDCGVVITCNINKTERDGCDKMVYNKITDAYPKWKFSIPFYETLCSVKVYYEDYDLIDKTYQTSINCSYLALISGIFMKGSAGSMTVGKPYNIQCSVEMSEKVDSSIIKIDWSGPDGSIITNDSRINIHPTVSVDGIIHNSTLQFLYLSQHDSGSFVCNVTLVDTTLSQTFELENITTPISSIFMKSSARSMTMGKPYSIQCNVHMSEKVESSIIKIDWSGPNGSIITSDSRINIHSTVSIDGIIHNSTLQFLYLSQSDNGSFVCNVTLVDTTLSLTQTFELENITTPITNVFVQGSTNSLTMGNPYSIQCSVEMSEKINSHIVKIDWTRPHGSITNENRVIIHPTVVSNDSIIYTSILQFFYRDHSDNGLFICSATVFYH